jgi:cyclic lactone autoinducer peptide
MKKRAILGLVGSILVAVASFVALGTSSFWLWHQPKTPKALLNG